MQSVSRGARNLVTLTVAGLAAFAPDVRGEAPRGGEIEWGREDLAALLDRAGREGRPAMLYFTDDC